MADLSEQDKALCEALQALEDCSDYPFDFNTARSAQIRIRELSAQLAEHPNATDWQNRSGRAEQEAAELREQIESFCEVINGAAGNVKKLHGAQRKIDALQQHAEALAEALGNCADSLEAEIEARRGAVLERTMKRDLAEVVEARQTLAAYREYRDGA